MNFPFQRLARHLIALFVVSSLQVLAAPAPLVSKARFTHPGSGQVFYFVLTDRFANGKPGNDTGGISGGTIQHGFDPTVISHYHGGDFVGMTAKLDYIKNLGTTAIWITPPFVNKPVQEGSAGYHGYWILDFTKIDPHLGTDAEFREFVTQAHARGIRVYLDIVVNHTADVIKYKDGGTNYVDISHAPYRDASGKVFDSHAVAYNGIGTGADFPRLAPDRSFAHVPIVDAAETHSKGPEWLNDVTLYHNRGNSRFERENSLHGDFVGLDDVFTENPAVVRGFIDVYSRWMRDYGIDGYRIDTVRHVNLEFWQAFGPAIRAEARKLGRPDFFVFGEVANEHGDTALLSEFTTRGKLDASLDFALFDATRDFVSRGRGSEVLARLFANDDYYTDGNNNADSIPTFISNHDAGRFGYFLKQDNPGIGETQVQELALLGYGLLFTVRGQPVLYYGDEQGMTGTGNDMKAREDMFASKAAGFRQLSRLGTSRKGSDDKFDEHHRFYRTLRELAALRKGHAALTHGAMIIRPTNQSQLFAFSRIERKELVEYLVALNSSRTETITATIQTSQAAGVVLQPIFESNSPDKPASVSLLTDAQGEVVVTMAPMQFAIWKAETALPITAKAPAINISCPLSDTTLAFSTRYIDGHTLVVRQELHAELSGSDGVAEVTFALQRASRPGQFEILGTDDAAPYRVFWQPPADLAPGDELTFIATVDDLRGHRSSTQVKRLKIAPSSSNFGIKGATVPHLIQVPDTEVTAVEGGRITLAIKAEGTEPLEYQWLYNGAEIVGATETTLTLEKLTPNDEGSYAVSVRNREGTVTSRETIVTVKKD